MIPRIFHFVYGLRKQNRAFPLMHYLCLESCRQVNRPERMLFHYLNEPWGPYWERIRPHLELRRVSLNPFVERFAYRDRQLEPFRYAHHADFIRLEQLVATGGVYADIDTLFVRPLPERLFEKPFVMGREMDAMRLDACRTAPTLCNALMMAEPGAAFGKRWLQRMSAAFDGSWSNHSTVLPQLVADEAPQTIHIEPRSAFFHFGPTPRDLFALFEAKVPMPEEVCSIHLWEHLWRDRKRTDFSLFHAGRLTDGYVRAGGSTYAEAARVFLPPEQEAPQPGIRDKAEAWAEGAAALAEERLADAKALAGRVLIPAIRHVKPGFGHLNLAKAHRAYRAAQRRLVTENPLEDSILRCVILWDEYLIFERGLRPEDVVIDVGAHIGAFTFAAHRLGSRRIEAFEPSPTLFPRLERHTRGLPGVTLHRACVFRSDRAVDRLHHSGAANSFNTGAGSVIFRGQAVDTNTRELRPFAEAEGAVAVVAMDEVLAQYERVKLLKLDCEGSEFPILLTSSELHRVERIVGEYHLLRPEEMRHVAPDALVEGVPAFEFRHLREKLEGAGFRVQQRAQDEFLGLFDATRENA